MKIKDRILEFRRVPSSELRPNPKNWRKHSKEQANALRGLLAEVGIAGAVLARKCEDDTLMLIDGHLRAETLGNQSIPVLILDVTEDEADKLLATIDPLGDMAQADQLALSSLIEGLTFESESLAKMMAELCEDFKPDKSLDDTDEPLSGAGGEPEDTMSGVRLIHLFLDDLNIGEFNQMVTGLTKKYGTENITDTIYEALRRESDKL